MGRWKQSFSRVHFRPRAERARANDVGRASQSNEPESSVARRKAALVAAAERLTVLAVEAEDVAAAAAGLVASVEASQLLRGGLAPGLGPALLSLLALDRPRGVRVRVGARVRGLAARVLGGPCAVPLGLGGGERGLLGADELDQGVSIGHRRPAWRQGRSRESGPLSASFQQVAEDLAPTERSSGSGQTMAGRSMREADLRGPEEQGAPDLVGHPGQEARVQDQLGPRRPDVLDHLVAE